MPEQPRVYISAAASDAAFATTLATDLARYGLTTLHLAPEAAATELTPAQRTGIAACPWFLVVQSPAAVASPLVRSELAEAIRLVRGSGRGIVAVMRDPAVLPLPPGAPVRIQVVDAMAQSYADVLRETAEAILGPAAQMSAAATPTPMHAVTRSAAPRRLGAASRRELLIGGGIIAAGLTVAGGALLVRRLPLGMGDTGQATPTSGPAHVPGTLIAQLIGHGDKVNDAAWSPDGGSIATASADGTAKLWPSSGGAATLTYAVHRAAVNTVAWSRDSRRIASASDDTTTRLWTAADGMTAQTLTGPGTSGAAAQWSPDATRVATCDDAALVLWDANTGARLASFANPGNGFSACAWSPDGQYIAASSWDKTVKIWSTATQLLSTNYTQHPDRVFSVAWSPDGQFLASAGQGGQVQVWRPDGTRALVYTAHRDGVLGLAWSPDSRALASGGGNGAGYGDTTVRVWQATTGTTTAVYTGHARYINGLAWSPDGTRVVSASDDGTAHIWWAR